MLKETSFFVPPLGSLHLGENEESLIWRIRHLLRLITSENYRREVKDKQAQEQLLALFQKCKDSCGLKTSRDSSSQVARFMHETVGLLDLRGIDGTVSLNRQIETICNLQDEIVEAKLYILLPHPDFTEKLDLKSFEQWLDAYESMLCDMLAPKTPACKDN